MKWFKIFFVSAFLFCPLVTQAELSGYLGLEGRFFLKEPIHSNQPQGDSVSLLVEPEFSHTNEENTHRFQLTPFYHLDSQDRYRTHADIREFYWLGIHNEYELLVGVNRLFWGVTESRHLINVVNQIDQVEDVDEEDFMGQPMVMLGSLKPWGTIRFYALPYFRERTLPGNKGRLRFSVPFDQHATLYQSRAEKTHFDFVVRYNHYIDDYDFGIYYFRGTNREPRFTPLVTPAGATLVPSYDIMQQVGGDLQITKDALLLKFEGIWRNTFPSSFYAHVAGFEYTLYDIFGKGWDLGLILEHHLDNRRANASYSGFDRNVFAGFRWTLNDIKGTELLGGVTAHTSDFSTLWIAEYSRRIGDNYKLELTLRGFSNVDNDSPTYPLRDDHHFMIKLQRYF